MFKTLWAVVLRGAFPPPFCLIGDGIWRSWGADHMRAWAGPWIQTCICFLFAPCDGFISLNLFGRPAVRNEGDMSERLPIPLSVAGIQFLFQPKSQAVTRLLVLLLCPLTRDRWNWMGERNFKLGWAALKYTHTVREFLLMSVYFNFYWNES